MPSSPDQKAPRDDYADAIVPGLVLRVTDRGHKSFVLRARYPLQPKNPTRRTLGDYGVISLEQARDKARAWITLIQKGIDPKIEEERQRAAAQRIQANTFSAVAGDWLDQEAGKLAKSAEAESIIRGEFIKRWGARPITDIAKIEVSNAILAIKKGKKGRPAPYQARNAFALLRLLYKWAIGKGVYGVESSPLEQLSVKALCGASEARERILTDAELRAVWDAAGRMGYPYGPVFRMLILTGQREREISDMLWDELGKDELGKEMITVAASRMKGGRAHQIPLTPEALKLLQVLPRFTGGDYVFTTTAGVKPINGFSKAKVRIDKLSGVSGWVIHDLRRSMRSHLSALPVQQVVRERVIAHAKKGLEKNYDQYEYQAEKRHCLELWEKRLMAIVEPPPADVADLNEVWRERTATA